MKYIFFFIITFPVLFFSCNKNDHPKPDNSGMFIKFFGGAKDDVGYAVKESGDGGFVLVGALIPEGRSDKNCYIVKTDADGNKIWDHSFGKEYDEEALDVKVDPAGNYWVAGYQKNAQDSSDFLLLKYSKDGILMDTFSYGIKDRNEIARFVTVTAEGGILLAGTRQQAGSTQLNMYFVKLLADTVAWQKELGLNALYDQVGTVVELPSRDLLWCGTVNRGTETDLRICRTDAYSNLKWDISIGEGDGKNQSGKEIHPTQDGNFIIGGTEISQGSTTALLIKVNEYGTVLWQTAPGGAGIAVNSVYPCSDGNYVLAGEKEKDYLLMQTDQEGNFRWEKRYGGGGTDKASRVVQTGDNGFLLIGTVYVANNTLLGVIKTDPQGEVNRK